MSSLSGTNGFVASFGGGGGGGGGGAVVLWLPSGGASSGGIWLFPCGAPHDFPLQC